MGRRARFWSAEQLMIAVGILMELADDDEQGKFFGGESVPWLLYHAYGRRSTPISTSAAQQGVQVLTVLGFLDHQPSGPAPSGYKRRFYPDARASITEEEADAAWRARGEAGT